MLKTFDELYMSHNEIAIIYTFQYNCEIYYLKCD